jgi:CheY-like chemotaxis protein
LVVEDNAFNMEVIKNFLAKQKHTFEWTPDGLEAVKVYETKHEHFDLILMDCEMPVMDGYEATRTIRRMEKERNLPHKPIIGVTAFGMTTDRQKCLDSGSTANNNGSNADLSPPSSLSFSLISTIHDGRQGWMSTQRNRFPNPS